VEASSVCPKIKAYPQATDEADHSVKLCVGAGKLGMLQATDKTKKLTEDACTDGTCKSVILQRESQTGLTCTPPLDLQLLLDGPNRALARQAASHERLCMQMQVCKQINQMTVHSCLMPLAG